MKKAIPSRVLKAISAEPWLITDEWLDRIVEIASRDNIGSFESEPQTPMVSVVDGTAIVDVRGPVFRYANLFTEMSGATSTEVLSSEIARLNKDSKVQRVVMRYDTPGGMASGASELSEQLYNLSKPHTAYVTGMCCSLGYFWASQADEIIIAEDAIIGNIGTRTAQPEEEKNIIVSKNAPNKLLNKKSAQQIVDDLEEVFISHVARGRGVSVDHVLKRYGQGSVFVGQKAIQAGLADQVMTLDQLLSYKTGKKMTDKKDASNEAQLQKEKDEAYQAGFAAGKAEIQSGLDAKIQASAEQAAADENARCVAIFEASEGKPMKSVLSIVRTRAIGAEQAKEIVSGFPTGHPMDSMMSDTNPDISSDVDDPSVVSMWEQISKKA